MPYRVLFATGGTGGHVYPAVATAQKLLQQVPTAQILFAGGKLSANRFLAESAFPFAEIFCGTFSSKNPLNLLKSSYAIAKGFTQSCKLLSEFSPKLILAFGSYHTFPLLLAAAYKRIPYLLHEANTIPGRVNRLLSKGSATTATFFPGAADHLSGRVTLARMPLRWCSVAHRVPRVEANAYFGLDPTRTTILLFGGSQGARALNSLFAQMTEKLWSSLSEKLQILHFTGDTTAAEKLQNHYRNASISAVVKPFETQMHLAWQVADLAICRAGASTVAEALEFSVPTILIPYPYGKDDHQTQNAIFVAEQLQGGIHLPETDANPERMINLLQQIFSKDQPLVRQMQINLQTYNAEIETRPHLVAIATALLNYSSYREVEPL
jgi:UDP-N-acetylglucosamine--N-acetylmuramyl-(pentapeptide) pyrophosphoryl-undecaprenol N-acetylglucosamine transferase